MLLPVMLLFFQNCSDLVSSENISSFNDPTSGVSLTPVMVNSSESFGFTSKNDCKSLDEAIPLYNQESHLCFVAKNECEYEILLERNFEQDMDNKCAQAIDDSSFNPAVLTKKSALDLGFENSRDLICTQQYLEMINLKKGICVSAADGCQINYLNSMGFNEDNMNLCN